jgi:hypothetical protein
MLVMPARTPSRHVAGLVIRGHPRPALPFVGDNDMDGAQPGHDDARESRIDMMDIPAQWTPSLMGRPDTASNGREAVRSTR